MTDTKFWELVHPGGPKGLLTEEPSFREQDKEAKLIEGYIVCFFPRITRIGNAQIHHRNVVETFSQTPEAAITKFMDGIAKSEKWETYVEAGHKVRKVRMIDLGDAVQNETTQVNKAVDSTSEADIIPFVRRNVED